MFNQWDATTCALSIWLGCPFHFLVPYICSIYWRQMFHSECGTLCWQGGLLGWSQLESHGHSENTMGGNMF
jgi:hypothetical protein